MGLGPGVQEGDAMVESVEERRSFRLEDGVAVFGCQLPGHLSYSGCPPQSGLVQGHSLSHHQIPNWSIHQSSQIWSEEEEKSDGEISNAIRERHHGGSICTSWLFKPPSCLVPDCQSLDPCRSRPVPTHNLQAKGNDLLF